MLDKLRQAKRMWQNGLTHGEILEVTGLTHEAEYAVTLDNVTPETVYSKLPSLKSGMKAVDIKKVVGYKN